MRSAATWDDAWTSFEEMAVPRAWINELLLDVDSDRRSSNASVYSTSFDRRRGGGVERERARRRAPVQVEEISNTASCIRSSSASSSQII